MLQRSTGGRADWYPQSVGTGSEGAFNTLLPTFLTPFISMRHVIRVAQSAGALRRPPLDFGLVHSSAPLERGANMSRGKAWAGLDLWWLWDEQPMPDVCRRVRSIHVKTKIHRAFEANM